MEYTLKEILRHIWKMEYKAKAYLYRDGSYTLNERQVFMPDGFQVPGGSSE
jgi:hypothetical protein